MFECSTCLLEKEETTVHVASDAVCSECFKEELFQNSRPHSDMRLTGR